MRGSGPHRSVDAGGLRGAVALAASLRGRPPCGSLFPGTSRIQVLPPPPGNSPSRAESPQNGVSVEGKGGGQRHRLWTVS